MLEAQANAITKEPALVRQPPGLFLLFFTELWERFGFYTIQTIIILYMTKGLFLSDQKANLLYATFASFVYLTPLIGGYLADRYLGFQRSISIGGILFIVSYLVCASSNKDIFFIGLSLLIVANGFFKPSVSAIVGELYEKNDPRRDGGFTLFYMGINIGALIPPLIAGTLVLKYGWHSGFILAAVGMAIGQLVFMYGRKTLGHAGLYPNSRNSHTYKISFFSYVLGLIGLIITLGLMQLAFRFPEVINFFMEGATIIVFMVIFFFLFKEPPAERKKMLACLILIAISLGFWSLYNQAYTSLMLFADRNVDHRFLGLPLSSEATQFFNPFFIIMLSPLLSRLWINMGHNGMNPSIQLKFALGAIFMCAGYFILELGIKYYGNEGMITPGWLCASYFLQTIAELLISPVGLAMITLLSPKHLTGLMMGVWFFTQAASFTVGGVLANVAAIPQNSNAVSMLSIYSHAFFTYGVIALILSVISISLLPLLNRMIKQS